LTFIALDLDLQILNTFDEQRGAAYDRFGVGGESDLVLADDHLHEVEELAVLLVLDTEQELSEELNDLLLQLGVHLLVLVNVGE